MADVLTPEARALPVGLDMLDKAMGARAKPTLVYCDHGFTVGPLGYARGCPQCSGVEYAPQTGERFVQWWEDEVE